MRGRPLPVLGDREYEARWNWVRLRRVDDAIVDCCSNGHTQAIWCVAIQRLATRLCKQRLFLLWESGEGEETSNTRYVVVALPWEPSAEKIPSDWIDQVEHIRALLTASLGGMLQFCAHSAH